MADFTCTFYVIHRILNILELKSVAASYNENQALGMKKLPVLPALHLSTTILGSKVFTLISPDCKGLTLFSMQLLGCFMHCLAVSRLFAKFTDKWLQKC